MPGIVGVETTVANSVLVHGDPKNTVIEREMDLCDRNWLMECPEQWSSPGTWPSAQTGMLHSEFLMVQLYHKSSDLS